MAADVVTQADQDSEAAILSVLTSHFPDYSILSEEAGLLERGSEWIFVVDPLDGSHNFVLGIPNFSVSITLMRAVAESRRFIVIVKLDGSVRRLGTRPGHFPPAGAQVLGDAYDGTNHKHKV